MEEKEIYGLHRNIRQTLEASSKRTCANLKVFPDHLVIESEPWTAKNQWTRK